MGQKFILKLKLIYNLNLNFLDRTEDNPKINLITTEVLSVVRDMVHCLVVIMSVHCLSK